MVKNRNNVGFFILIFFHIFLLLEKKFSLAISCVCLGIVLFYLKDKPICLKMEKLNKKYLIVALILAYIFGPWGLVAKPQENYYLINNLFVNNNLDCFAWLNGELSLYILPYFVKNIFCFSFAKLVVYIEYVLMYYVNINIVCQILKKYSCKEKIMNIFTFFSIGAPIVVGGILLNSWDQNIGISFPTSTFSNWIGYEMSPSMIEIFIKMPILFTYVLLFTYVFFISNKNKDYKILFLIITICEIPLLGVSFLVIILLEFLKNKVKTNYLICFLIFEYFILFVLSYFLCKKLTVNYFFHSIKNLYFIVFSFVFYLFFLFVFKKIERKHIWYFSYILLLIFLQSFLSYNIFVTMSFPIIFLFNVSIYRIVSVVLKNGTLYQEIFVLYNLSMSSLSSFIYLLGLISTNINIM